MIFDHCDDDEKTSVEEVNEGDLREMEVDLWGREKEKRLLHFFVRGKQQKGLIFGVPDRVKFGVSTLISFFVFYLYFYIYIVY